MTVLETMSGVPASLARTLVGDFLPMTIDIERSSGSYLWDEAGGRPVLDMGMFFSSSPLGHNPTPLAHLDAERKLLAAAKMKPSNPDFASRVLADSVSTFRRLLMPADMPHLFLIDGGAAAVENALKVAFDWKSQRAGTAEADLQALHLRWAFHGRSGYTMSLTNTDPAKTARFPKFDWPRIDVPARGEDGGDDADRVELSQAERRTLDEIEATLVADGDRIACFVYEPIQGEGGDRHLGAAFLRAVQSLCIEHDVLTIADEVQTGGGIVGARWAHETLGLRPDLVAFGKRLQVCGVVGGRRVDDLDTNAFAVPGRISSTWGGSLVDLVRFALLYEYIARENVIARAASMGPFLRAGLDAIVDSSGGRVSAARSRGLWGAVTLETRELRDAVLADALAEHDTVLLPCGTRSIRWRPSLLVTEQELALSFEAVQRSLTAVNHS
ncbi:MAG: aminotransferase class III-fold pyridoxal phosphate-dependent enzyme [Rhodococcus sp. (in: high G+C Gram-positive bacteria)]